MIGKWHSSKLTRLNKQLRAQVVLTLCALLALAATFAVPAPAAAATAASLEGTVWGWGNHNYGMRGDGSTSWSGVGPRTWTPTPGQVIGLTNVMALAAGGSHSLGLKQDGTVWAWGYGGTGQLGNITREDSITPKQVSGLTDVMALAAGSYHSLGLKQDGTVWAFGWNYHGQLGDGTTTMRSTPGQVSGLNHVVALAAGSDHSLALKSDGTVWTWGYGDYGQLGNGRGGTIGSFTPGQVSGLTDVVALAADNNHSLALKRDGTVWAWGYNGEGQLGNGTTVDSLTPRQVSGLNDVVALAAGTDHNLALKSDGTVWAWGEGRYGQLGNGTTVASLTPQQVSGLTDVVALDAGEWYSLALKSDGTVWGWGYNGWNQISDTSIWYQLTPGQVSGLTNIAGIAAGNSHNLAFVRPANQPPTVAAGARYTVVEGATVTVMAAGSDPDGDALAYAWDLDNDGTFETAGQTATFSAASLDGPSSHTIAVRATDSNGGSATAQTTVEVANVAPVLGAISATAEPVAVNTSVNTGARFADAGVLDSHTAEWNWGDGTTSVGMIDAGTVTGSHSYTAAGVYTLKLTLTDDDGASATQLFQYVVVYDPEGGFVTGGGWINSPTGACKLSAACESATGKATFGFVSKYQKGATVPTGQTEFEFRAGGFRFHSATYEWLVVSGAKAQYKGSGTINGSGDYGFMLTASDGQVSGGGGVDTFRIKIWDKVTGNVVYDNQPGDADDAAASTAIAGGSIVIHSK